MVSTEIRRHSIKDGATPHLIGPKGHALARAVGHEQLRGRGFTHFFASGLFRTHQTMVSFAEGAGDFVLYKRLQSAPFNLDDPRSMALYKGISKAEAKGQDLFQAAIAFDPEGVEIMARKTADLFWDWIGQFTDGDRVFVVNHSPSMEITLSGLVPGCIIPALAECQGFRLLAYPDTRTVEVVTPDLDPSLDPTYIRRQLFLSEAPAR